MSQIASDIRAFLAIPLPTEVIAKLNALQKKLREVLNDVTWTRPESLHLTIRFFGNVRAEQLQQLQEKIGNVCASASPFPVRVENVGSFGDRVIWVGVHDVSRELTELESRLRRATSGLLEA